ncbi:MAG TPA: hypothetical protein VM901_11125 [Bdellovibrionota bacterium]|nr:hypothetical protein [Bdellovibrionota bacterium]
MIPNTHARETPGRVHLIWDLDGTLVDHADDLPEDTPGLVEVYGRRYKIAAGASWILPALAAHPLVASQSYFSGGSEERNHSLLDKLNTEDGPERTFRELGHEVFSKHHLKKPDGSPVLDWDDVFFRRGKKDLRLAHDDLENVILIDDWVDFVPDDQRGNVLGLGKAYVPFATYAEARSWLRENYHIEGAKALVPPNEEEWLRHHFRLYRAYNIIMEALDALAAPANQRSFRELVAEKNAEIRLLHVHRGIRRLSERCDRLLDLVANPPELLRAMR